MVEIKPMQAYIRSAETIKVVKVKATEFSEEGTEFPIIQYWTESGRLLTQELDNRPEGE